MKPVPIRFCAGWDLSPLDFVPDDTLPQAFCAGWQPHYSQINPVWAGPQCTKSGPTSAWLVVLDDTVIKHKCWQNVSSWFLEPLKKKAKSRVSLRGLGFVLDDTVIKHKQEQSWDADVSAWGLFTNSWLLFASNPSSSGDKPQSLWVSHPCYVPVRAVFSSLKYESIIVQVH